MPVRAAIACCLLYLAFGPVVAIYGSTAPAIIDEWHLSPTFAGALGSYLTIGMLIGSIVVGTVDNVVGTKVSITGALALATLGTALCAVAPSPTALGVLLAIAGIGWGAVQPPLIAYTLEYAPAKHRTLVYVAAASLFSLGSALTSALAIPVLPNLGWRALYLLSVVPMVVAVPFVVTAPESVASLVTRGRAEQARRLAVRLGTALPEKHVLTKAGEGGPRTWFNGIALLFSRAHVAATLLFWVGMFCSYVLIFSILTWLPELMSSSGRLSLSSALGTLVAVYLGAIIGPLVGAAIADRLDNLKLMVVASFLAFGAGTGLVLVFDSGVFWYFLLAGVGVGGTQVLFGGYQSRYYPIEGRATGVGWAAGVGQIGAISGPVLTGFLVAAGISLDSIFMMFTVIAVFAAFVVALVPKPRPSNAVTGVPVDSGDGADASRTDASPG